MDLHDAPMPLRVTFDPQTDAAYVYLQEQTALDGAIRTVYIDMLDLGGAVGVDVDSHGRIVGLEVLDAARLLPAQFLARLI